MLTRRLLTAISCVFLIGLLGAISVQAQERDYTIRGRVMTTDADEGLPGANVQIDRKSVV